MAGRRLSRRSLLGATGAAVVLGAGAALDRPWHGTPARVQAAPPPTAIPRPASLVLSDGLDAPPAPPFVPTPIPAPVPNGVKATSSIAHAPPDALHFLPMGMRDPEPPVVARIRLIGDMHFGFTSQERLDAVTRDLASLPAPAAVLSPGDVTHFGAAEGYASAQAWLRQWYAPFYAVTGNHTFWNASEAHRDTSGDLYRRFVDRWGTAMPAVWEIAGVRFVGIGPTGAGPNPTDASVSLAQIGELAALLALAPAQPTVLVMHSPLQHTVLADGPAATCYTSDDPGFFQRESAALRVVLGRMTQVVLVLTGHTHSPLHARGLFSMIDVGKHAVPQFNAMALPFVRRITKAGPIGPQELVTWELAITPDALLLRGRDHLARRDVALATIPLERALATPTINTVRHGTVWA